MLDSAISSAAIARLGNEAGGTIDFDATFDLGERSLRIEDSFAASAPSALGGFVAHDVSAIATMLLRNGLGQAKLKKIDVRARARPEIELAWMEAAVPERNTVHPGEHLPVSARLKPWRGESMTVPLSVKIPEDATGDIELVVGGPNDLDHRDNVALGDRIPTDIDDLLVLIQERRPGRGLFARTYLPRAGLRSAVDTLSSLPPSARAILAEPAGLLKKPIAEAFGPETRVGLPRVVFGSVTVPLHVVPR
jgi:hypothetical protein